MVNTDTMHVPDHVHPLARSAWRALARIAAGDATDYGVAVLRIHRAIRPAYVGTFAPGQVGARTEAESVERERRRWEAARRITAWHDRCAERQREYERGVLGGVWAGD